MNASTGKVTGRPLHDGTSTVTVTASDDSGTTARTMFSWTIQSNPSLSRVSLAGVGATRPKLSFTVAAGREAPKLQTLTVTLPSGLSFSRSRAMITISGLKVKHLRFTASLQRGTLVLKLKTAAQQVRVTISYPRLKSGGSLAAQVARHSGVPITITVHVTDASRLNTKLTSKIKPRS